MTLGVAVYLHMLKRHLLSIVDFCGFFFSKIVKLHFIILSVWECKEDRTLISSLENIRLLKYY